MDAERVAQGVIGKHSMQLFRWTTRAVPPQYGFQHAVYEFDDLVHAQAIQGSNALTRLVAEFDRVWGNKVTHSRDFVEVIQALGA